MPNQWDLTGENIENTYQRVLQTPDGATFYDGTGSLVTLPSADTSSLLTTSSFNSWTGSNLSQFSGTSSFATTSSYALNGGVTQLQAGPGIILSPTNGLGNVTITSTAGAYNTTTGSYGSFYNTGSQIAVSTTTIYSMSLSTTDISNGVYVSGSDKTRIYVANAGVYNLQFSAQFRNNSNNNPQDVSVWLRKNDNSSTNDIVDSNSMVTVPGAKGGDPGQIIAAWNFFLQLAAGDFVQLLWHAEAANVITLETIPAGTNPVHPLTPSLIATVQRVDTFLSNTGSFSGSFIGEHTGSFNGSFTGSLFGTASWTDSASHALTASYYQEIDPIFVAKSASLATTGSNTFIGNQVVSGSYIIDVSSSADALRVTQRGSGNAIIVEDQASDTSPFIVDSTGRVGIGTSTPQYFLVASASTSTDTVLYFDGGTAANSNIVAAADTTVKIPSLVLWDRTAGAYSTGVAAYIGIDRSSSGVPPVYANRNDMIYVNNFLNKGHYFITNNGGSKGVRMVISASGNVGIGITTPLYKLDVNGTSRFTGDMLISGNLIPGGPYTNNTSSYSLGSPTAAWQHLYVSNGSIYFLNGSASSSISLDSSGSISIPNTSLTGSLEGTASFALTASYFNGIINGGTF